MVASTIDEGAGPLDSSAFHDKVERKAIELSFRAGRDYFRGTMRTLKENRDEAFDCLRLSLNEPRFDPEAVSASAPSWCPGPARIDEPERHGEPPLVGTAFPGHPYGRPVEGTADSISRITSTISNSMRTTSCRATTSGSRWSATSMRDTGKLIDRTFGSLPAKAELKPVPAIVPQGLGRKIVIKLDVPQAVVNSARPASAGAIPISWPPISSTTFSAADHSRRGSIAKCARSAGSPMASPTR